MKFETDSFYISKVLEGDVMAYSFLVDKYKDMAFTIALRIVGNREDAEEIAQDAFLKAYQSLNKFKGSAKFSTWLYKIVFNGAISKTRKKKVVNVDLGHEIIQNYTDDELFESLKNIDQNEQQVIVKKTIDKLDPIESALINLYYFENLPTEEIATILNLSISNVKVKLHRTRAKMNIEIMNLLSVEEKKIYHEF